MNHVDNSQTLVFHSQARLGAACAFSWLAAAATTVQVGGISGALAGTAVLVAIPTALLLLQAARIRD